ncbi:DPEP2 neighbor protein-like isoform X2 [Fukomys damarensis]|uniref:DPEP2 neighbor protein-like isoform X2 n=1 Tax=Fukomys damarensis TaxID=885580 RepID=UPI001455D8F4|nr:DPEP2 neighbor protein-like isoform X2 [Fukomys damarensis]
MSDQISYIQAKLPPFSWECNPAAVLPTAPPIPVYYHVRYRGCTETQVSWHGETYCLVGGYRAYGDAAIATPAKAREEKPTSRWVYVDACIISPAKIEAQKPAYMRVPKKP